MSQTTPTLPQPPPPEKTPTEKTPTLDEVLASHVAVTGESLIVDIDDDGKVTVTK